MRKDNLFPIGKTLSKAKRIDLVMNNPFVQAQGENLKSLYRTDLETREKKKKKDAPTLEQIIEGVKKEVLCKDSFDGFERGMGRVSASKLTTYKGCRFAYLLQYGLHLERPIHFPHIVYGEKMHSVLEEFNLGNLTTVDEMVFGKPIIVEENGKPKEEKILGWRAKWYGAVNSRNIFWRFEGQEHALYKKGVKMIGAFYEKEKDTPRTHPDLVETKFDLVLNCKPYAKNSYTATGFFDRIDISDNKIIITDYKSGDTGDVSLDLGLQLTLYWHAYNDYASKSISHFPKPKNPEDIELILYDLTTLEKKTTFRNNIDMKYLVSEICSADKEIKSNYFKPFIGFHCSRNCFWNELCHDLLTANKKELLGILIPSSDNAQAASYL